MKEKYKNAGLNLKLIEEAFPNLEEYEEALVYYLGDEHFDELGELIKDEDYGMAKDMIKGLFLLAQDLRVYPLYEALLDLYEDITYETYEEMPEHYREMKKVYRKIKNAFIS